MKNFLTKLGEKIGKLIGDLLELSCCLIFCFFHLLVWATILLFILRLFFPDHHIDYTAQ